MKVLDGGPGKERVFHAQKSAWYSVLFPFLTLLSNDKIVDMNSVVVETRLDFLDILKLLCFYVLFKNVFVFKNVNF